MYSFCFSDDRRKFLLRWTLSLRKVVQSLSLYCAARLLMGRNYLYAGLSVQRKVAQSSGLYCATRLMIGGNYWYAGLSGCGEYWSKDQLELKIRGQHCSDRLFSGQYCTSGAPQRHGTGQLNCLSHLYSTPHKQSTGQMKYRWETLNSKLSMKMLITRTETLLREYRTLISWDCPFKGTVSPNWEAPAFGGVQWIDILYVWFTIF